MNLKNTEPNKANHQSRAILNAWIAKRHCKHSVRDHERLKLILKRLLHDYALSSVAMLADKDVVPFHREMMDLWHKVGEKPPEVLPVTPSNKDYPVYSGVLKYFPLAIKEIAHTSKVGNDQHNKGEPLHWAREKSGDELDALSRHLLLAGKIDADGVRHSAKIAWRALSNLEKELEGET